jgi:uncharacterized protein YqjF (DUF2071 family)
MSAPHQPISGEPSIPKATSNGSFFLGAEWGETLFLHYLLAPESMGLQLPPGLELELYEGQACVSLVALTMSGFESLRPSSLGSLLQWIPSQRFLNLRTYVRWQGEPGAFFMWGWLSRPFGLGAPLGLCGLSASFAQIDYGHSETLSGRVRDRQANCFQYRGDLDGSSEPRPCRPGSLGQFALEQYTGFFCRGRSLKRFQVQHVAWAQRPVRVSVLEHGLITRHFPWFAEAKFAGADLAQGLPRVLISRPQGLRVARAAQRARHGLSAFYEIP